MPKATKRGNELLPLKVARLQTGTSRREMLELLGWKTLNTLIFIEHGQCVPTRDQAKQLYDYYEGTVDLIDIYDPELNKEINQEEN
jgi:transcriptional regulator with XRE-family HTH domain